MFGTFDTPLNINESGIFLSIENKEKVQFYSRECLGEKIETHLITEKNKILIHPVEPVNIPKKITQYFLIEFDKSIFIEPNGKNTIYVKFPIEIGVFTSGKKDIEIIDVFSIVPQKYSIYGDPRNGVLCRYYLSEVFYSIPQTDLLQEGVVELNIINTTSKWVELTKAVFNAYGMKMYYDNNLVAMKANIRILGEEIAETYFINASLQSGMKKAMELYTAKKIHVNITRFVMEWSL